MKRNINRNNYEEFFIDYLDGRLTDEEIIMMEKFLVENPDLRNELEGLEGTYLRPQDVAFPGKDLIRQIDTDSPLSEENFDDYCVAAMEGDLDKQQAKSLEEFISAHPEKGNDRELYQKVKLVPPAGLTYGDKSRLKKSVFIVHRREIYAFTALAAGIALMIILFVTFPGNNNIDPSSGISMVDEKEAEKTEKAEKAEESEAASDSTAVQQKPAPGDANDKAGKEPVKKRIQDKIKSATDISFKVTVPVARSEEKQGSSLMDEKEKKQLMNNITIDRDEINRSLAYFDAPVKESILPRENVIYTDPVVRLSNPSEYLTLEEYAKQRLSTFVFGEANKEEDLSLWSVASAGINKLNSLVGSNVKLDRAVDDEGKTRGISFDAGIFSVTAPVNRDE